MIICLCEGIKEKDVQEAIRQGAHCINDIKNMTGAGTNCGACRQEIKYLLHHKGKSALHYHESENRKATQKSQAD